MNTVEAIAAGHALAKNRTVIGWGVAGFFFVLIAILVAYLRRPKLPVELAAQVESDVLPLFERAYVERLKKRQVSATWIGAIIGFSVGMLPTVVMLLLSLMASI